MTRFTTVVLLSIMLASSAVFAADKDSPSWNLTPLYTFLGEADGADPSAGVTFDSAGNLYGTAARGGNFNPSPCASLGCGVVFKIDTRQHESILYSFSGSDGANPSTSVLRDSSGLLYSTTSKGGANGDGTVFKLRPKPNSCATALCPWNELVFHNFGASGEDGEYPYGDLIRDAEGNIYGVTEYGGTGSCSRGCGTVFKVDSEGNYTILWNFAGAPNDGSVPTGPLLMDQMGNLYGTTWTGGSSNYGTVFELMPSGSGWTEQPLYSFRLSTDGGYPASGLISDAHGNLYGTTEFGGYGSGNGVVFEMSPSGSGWTETVLYAFTGPPDGASPVFSRLLLDSSGNLYGTTSGGGTSPNCPLFGPNNCGTVFELSPNGSSWTETILWNFSGGADGSNPWAPVVMDGQGNLYGTTRFGGDLNSQSLECVDRGTPLGCGVVFKLTP